MKSLKSKVKVGGRFELICRDKEGKIKWVDYIDNLVVNQGLQHILDAVFSGASQVATWYLGLTAGSPSPAGADTLASHGGWTEFTDYSEGARQEWVEVRSSQTLTNTASKADFSINGSGTVGGAFLSSASTGTSGTLMSAGALSGGNRSVASGDTVSVTYEFSAADDGA